MKENDIYKASDEKLPIMSPVSVCALEKEAFKVVKRRSLD